MGKVHIIEKYIESDKIDSDITIASCSDLHLWTNAMLGLENVESLIKVLDSTYFDYLLIPGDIINDSSDLKDNKFRKKLLEVIYGLTNGRLAFYTLGNHDLMTMGTNGWEIGDDILLRETLKELSNVIYLDGLNNFSLTNQTLVANGYPTANINIIGAHLPFSFYSKLERESDASFLKYWNQMYTNACNPCIDGQYNILMLHSLRNFINLSKRQQDILLPSIDLGLGGHYHNGTIPNYISNLLLGNRGLISPQMELLKDNQRGIVEVNDVPFVINGYTNFRVENKVANNLFGGPSLVILHLLPTKNKVKYRK